LEFPGPYPIVAEQQEIEQASWLAFLLVLVGPEEEELQRLIVERNPNWGEAAATEGLLEPFNESVAAYRDWVGRAGSQEIAITGEQSWSPRRRFERTFERMALPGFGRSKRFELLAVLGAAGIYELEADSLHIPGTDPTSVAAKRIFNTGDKSVLERRAKELAEDSEVPLAALDHALVLWAS
jgi:hypothetical protein